MTTSTAGASYGFADLPALMSLMAGDEKHDFAAASTLDVLWVLYDRVLRVSPETLGAASRDRFYLSKGHGPMAYYAVLAAKGFLSVDALPGYGSFSSALGWHPDRSVLPGAEISSGSLGHGLPLAVGTALGLRARGLSTARVFVLIGDGELDEGSNHEAIAFAGRAGLGQLTTVVVDNASATHGWPGGIEKRFSLEGWSAGRADGRDHAALHKALTAPHPGQPRVVVAVISAAAAPAAAAPAAATAAATASTVSP
jgi:transketolase